MTMGVMETNNAIRQKIADGIVEDNSIITIYFLSDNEDEKTIILAAEEIAAGLQKAITFANPVYIDTNAKLTVVASGESIVCTAYLLKIVQ